jgi:hypothetical protein
MLRRGVGNHSMCLVFRLELSLLFPCLHPTRVPLLVLSDYLPMRDSKVVRRRVAIFQLEDQNTP